MSSHNGADSRPITEQLAEARARVELARLERRTKKLTESNLLWDWQSGYQDLLDRLRTDEGRLLLAPSTVQDRLYGSNWPFWRTWQEHSVIRAQARFICTTSDIARGALNGLCAYVIGRDGYTHVVEPRKGQDPPKDLLHCLQRIADDTAELNNLPEFEKESFRRSRRDGESLDRDYLRDDGLTEFEWIEPEQLLDDPSLPIDQGSFGVCTAPGRVTKIETFHVCYDGNSADGEHVPAEEVRFIKIGTDSTIKRGLSDFAYDVYERIKVAGRCVQNMTESAAIQSAVAEILEHETATPEVAQAFDDSEADYQTPNPWTGQQTNNRRVTPGESRKIPKGLKYVPPPFSDGLPAWDQTVRRALATVAVVWNAPEWLVSSDTSANAYANAVEAQAPFRRRCESEQSFYRHHFRRRIVRALKNACEAGKVRTAGRTWSWDEVRRLCEVQSEPPSLEVRKPLEEAQTNQIRVQAQVLSPQQWCQEDGRDYEETVREIEEHEERTGGQGQAFGADDDQQSGHDVQAPAPGQGGGGASLADLLGEGGEDEEGLSEALLEDAASKGRHKPGDRWQGQSGRWFTMTQDNHVVPAAAHAGGDTGRGGQKQSVLRAVLDSVKGAKAGAGRLFRKLKAGAGQHASPKARRRLKRVARLAAAVEHKVMIGFAKAKQAAEAAARERGASPEAAARTARILSTVDVALAWTVNMPVAGALTGSMTAAKVSSWIPIASLAYLAYSTARNPLATIRAAKAVLRGKPAGVHEEVEPETVGLLLDRLDGAADPDRFMALVMAALDECGHDLRRALEMATEAERGQEVGESLQYDTWALCEAFTGEKQVTVRGKVQTWHYRDGKRVAGPKKEPPAKPQKAAKPTVEAAQALVGELLKAGRAGPEHVRDLAAHLMGLTTAQLGDLKRRLGLKASGAKAALAGKLAERALAAAKQAPPAKQEPPAESPKPPEQTPASPAAPAPAARAGPAPAARLDPALHEPGKKAMLGVVAGIKASAGLSAKQRVHYFAEAQKVLKRMPPRAAERLNAHVTEPPKFYATLEALADGMAASPGMAPEKSQAIRARRGKIGGAYHHRSSPDGKLQRATFHLDGEQASVAAKGQASTVAGIQAHEFSHAVDGPGYEHSGSVDWQEAWKAEMGANQLNTYSASKPSEGWAEFGRLLYAGEHEPDAVRAKFPKCLAYWQAQGLAPEGGTRESVALESDDGPMLPDLFAGRIELGEGGAHADVLVEAP